MCVLTHVCRAGQPERQQSRLGILTKMLLPFMAEQTSKNQVTESRDPDSPYLLLIMTYSRCDVMDLCLNGMRLCQGRLRSDVSKGFFPQSVAELWNSFPTEVVTALTSRSV